MSDSLARVESAERAIALFNDNRARTRLEVTRVTKSGKTQTRDFLGVLMSGNKSEHLEGAKFQAEAMWFSGQRDGYAAIMENLARVFPKLSKEIEKRNATVNTLKAEDPSIKLELINTANPGRRDVLASAIIARGMPGAEKGEKATLMAVVNHVAMLDGELQALIAERDAAEKALDNETAQA